MKTDIRFTDAAIECRLGLKEEDMKLLLSGKLTSTKFNIAPGVELIIKFKKVKE